MLVKLGGHFCILGIFSFLFDLQKSGYFSAFNLEKLHGKSYIFKILEVSLLVGLAKNMFLK